MDGSRSMKNLSFSGHIQLHFPHKQALDSLQAWKYFLNKTKNVEKFIVKTL